MECMIVGSKPYIIFGSEHLQPKKDGSSKTKRPPAKAGGRLVLW